MNVGWLRNLVGILAWAAFGAVNGMLIGAIIWRWLAQPLPPTGGMNVGAAVGGLICGVGRFAFVIRQKAGNNSSSNPSDST